MAKVFFLRTFHIISTYVKPIFFFDELNKICIYIYHTVINNYFLLMFETLDILNYFHN